MGIGAEGEPGVVVAEDAGDGFDIYAVLQCQGCESMSQVVQTDVGETGGLEDFVVDCRDGIWVVHSEGDRRGEHVLDFWVLFVFRFEDVDGFL